MQKTKFFTAICMAISLFCSSAALADKHGHGKGHHDDNDEQYEHKDKRHKHGKKDYDHDHVVIINNDREIIREYIYDDYNRHCPPGLQKKHGCPMAAKARTYVIGEVLPPRVIWEPLPTVVVERIKPAPVGYQYVTVDKDVLLMSTATHKIVDAITLLSAVGN